MKNDLPSDPSVRDALLLTILGLPELREKYGMGRDSLSSKIAIISPSSCPDADVDYFFAQGDLRQGRVDTGVSCGNILSAVGPFALESGLVTPSGPETTVRVLSVNTQVRSHIIVRTPEGRVCYDGDTEIDGVPGSAAPVLINFLNPEGSSTGRVLPTGRPSDRVEGVEVSCVDAAMPLVIACAADFGKTGYETPDELNADSALLARMETVRREAGRLMGFGDVSKRVLPKFDLVTPPRHGGVICSRYFTPAAAHTSHAVTGALCLAAACLIPGTVAARVARLLPENANRVVIEHPAGSLATEITLRMEGGAITIPTAAFVRTAARLGRGEHHAS
jgi:2-methylaconitate cis-trans-isomerase PrpF